MYVPRAPLPVPLLSVVSLFVLTASSSTTSSFHHGSPTQHTAHTQMRDVVQGARTHQTLHSYTRQVFVSGEEPVHGPRATVQMARRGLGWDGMAYSDEAATRPKAAQPQNSITKGVAEH